MRLLLRSLASLLDRWAIYIIRVSVLFNIALVDGVPSREDLTDALGVATIAGNADNIVWRCKGALDFSPAAFPATVCTFSNLPSLCCSFVRGGIHWDAAHLTDESIPALADHDTETKGTPRHESDLSMDFGINFGPRSCGDRIVEMGRVVRPKMLTNGLTRRFGRTSCSPAFSSVAVRKTAGRSVTVPLECRPSLPRDHTQYPQAHCRVSIGFN
jgi:hypothetical protein